MVRYFVKRLFISLLIIWGVITTCFILLHLAPGDPTDLYIRPEIDPSVIENIRTQLGFHLPVWQQYFVWIGKFISGQFGISFMHHQPVFQVLKTALPNTLKLTLIVFVLQFAAGIGLGILLTVKSHTVLGKLLNYIMLFLYSMPGFWLALLLILIFSLHLGWLPSSQMQSLLEVNGVFPLLWDQIKHMILPVLVLSVPFITYTARFVRDQLNDILSQDYTKAALTYGISMKVILSKYALKNALLPLITLIGLYLPFLLGGAVITEYIFAWPGMGRITVDAIFARDFPLILASNFIAALTVVIGNLISDLLYSMADPRITVDGAR